jgi:hypothetical protein
MEKKINYQAGETPAQEITRLACEFAQIYNDIGYHLALPHGVYDNITNVDKYARRGLVLGVEDCEIIAPDKLRDAIDRGVSTLQQMQRAARRIRDDL